MTWMLIPMAIASFGLFDALSRWLMKFDKDMDEGAEWPPFKWACWGRSCPGLGKYETRYILIALPSFDVIEDWRTRGFIWAQRVIFYRRPTAHMSGGWHFNCWRPA